MLVRYVASCRIAKVDDSWVKELKRCRDVKIIVVLCCITLALTFYKNNPYKLT